MLVNKVKLNNIPVATAKLDLSLASGGSDFSESYSACHTQKDEEQVMTHHNPPSLC